MQKQVILIKKNSNGKPQYIQLDLDDTTLTREYGLVGGAVQGTANTYEGVNIGKANEKTPEQVAEEAMDRLVKTKTKEGYIETASLDDLSALDHEVVFDLENIPESFCLSKPRKIISTLAMDKLIKSGNGKFFVKYNGIGHFIRISTDGEVTIFTRRWYDHTVKYPEIVADVKASGYPTGSLFYTEFCIDPTLQIPHMTAFSLMSSITKTDCLDGLCTDDQTACLELQKKHRVRAALITLLYCDNKEAFSFPYQMTLNSFRTISPDITEGRALFVPKEVPITSGAQAVELVQNNKDAIEGFVLWDTTQNMEVTFNGKPNRCASWKIKATGDKDVIADGWKKGTGSRSGMIGSLKICQYDAEGNRVDLGTLGGLKPNEGECDPANWTFPCVVEVKYDQIFPDTGKFQFGRFSKIHEDKVPSDVEVFTL